mmetsp:Transcript_23160/g.50341  ORF Transcript_23160/g.50341 Transcript_23160/m.50341 type:complete len:133 (-) Transcript_23160:3405-3803(-)
MAKGKGQSGGTTKEKKETREQRRARLEAEAAAREQCFKILPYVAGGILVLIVAFALWVRSVPPKVVEPPKVQINEQSFIPPESLAESGIKVDASSSSAGPPDVELNTETVTEEVSEEAAGDGTGAEEDVTEL